MIATDRNSRQRHRRLPVVRGAGLVCAAAAAAALLTGCGDDDGNDTKSDAATARAAAVTSSVSGSGSPLTEDQDERKALVPKVKTGHEEALRTAVGAVDGSKPVSIELKGPPETPRWEAEVATGDGAKHLLDVDAVTGKAGKARADADQDADDKRELADLLKKATVTAEQAARTATDKTKGTVSSVELDDTDGGAPKWSVDVVTTEDWNKTTFDIDATNRKILREHVDKD
ncbi:PepSY domain-containing protein [Streptomyces sp. NPDC023327]|uniref:PepSY domain-containing protein n=1 Tax=Streptomyces sp. NPDC023327 TaxID=3157088 RepID=UPI0033F8C657